MGRRETPLLPDGSPLVDFAIRLRELRTRSGLTYEQLAKQTGYGDSTLQAACAGKRLPDLRVVLALANACEGDEDSWRERYLNTSVALSGQRPATDRAAAGTENSPPTGQPAEESGDGAAQAPPAPAESRRRGRPWLPVAVIGILTVAAIAAITGWEYAKRPLQPVVGVRNTSESPPDGVWFDNAPRHGDSDKATGHGIYMNDQVRIQCWARDPAGPADRGDTLWYLVANITRPTVPGSGATNSGYIDDHYISSDMPPGTVIKGVKPCR